MTAIGQRTVTLPAPFPYQAEILDDPHRFKVVCVGRQAGKTTMSSLAIFYGHGPLLPTGKRLFQGALDGKTGWWIAPTYELAAVAFRRIKAWFGQKLWDSLKKSESKQDMWVEFPGGGCLRMKSAANPEHLVADTLDFLVIDEASRAKLGTWEISQITLTVRHTQRVRNLLAGGGWALIISTPKGKNQWFYDAWKRGQVESPDYKSWQLPSTVSPLFSLEEDIRYRVDLKPYLYEREIRAQFAVSDGSFFRAKWFQRAPRPKCAASFLSASLPIKEDARGELGPAGHEGERHLVVATWKKDPGQPLVLDSLFRELVRPAEIPGIIHDCRTKGNAQLLVVPHVWPLCEMSKHLPALPMHGIYDLPESGDDAERAAPAASMIMNGSMRFAEGADFVEVVQAELCAFPDPDEERSLVEAVALAARVRHAS
jgi:hypothetical protein